MHKYAEDLSRLKTDEEIVEYGKLNNFSRSCAYKYRAMSNDSEEINRTTNTRASSPRYPEEEERLAEVISHDNICLCR